jgi:hypothetical protein
MEKYLVCACNRSTGKVTVSDDTNMYKFESNLRSVLEGKCLVLNEIYRKTCHFIYII